MMLRGKIRNGDFYRNTASRLQFVFVFFFAKNRRFPCNITLRKSLGALFLASLHSGISFWLPFTPKAVKSNRV